MTIKSAVIYYNNGAAVTAPTFTYNRGYNILAKLEASFGVTFSLSISIPGRSGVIIAGIYVGIIDFDFIKLGSFPLQPSGNSLGPMLSIDTAQQTVSDFCWPPSSRVMRLLLTLLHSRA